MFPRRVLYVHVCAMVSLIQSHLGCLPLQDFALLQDVNIVMRAATRISHCIHTFLLLCVPGNVHLFIFEHLCQKLTDFLNNFSYVKSRENST